MNRGGNRARSNPRALRASACATAWLVLACRGGEVAESTRRAAATPEVSSTTVTAQVHATAAAPTPAALMPVLLDQVCATLGTPRPSTSGLFLVEDPKLRATLAGSRGHGIELAFRYLGPSAESAKLRSGRDRRQLGLELLARDTCNLLYVMWRIEPSAELVVSVKRNGTQSTHAECENRGYQRLRPTRTSPVPELVPGAEHRLRAEVAGGTLSVDVDGTSVWSGPLDVPALELSGKSGLRSDNARFEVLALHADVASAAVACDE
jgi:hypothetical protein